MQSDPNISPIKTSTMITSSNSLSRGSGMPNQVDDALLHAMFGNELSRVRTELYELRISAPWPPWRYSFPDASLDVGSDAASPGYTVPLLVLLPPARNAEARCLAC